MTASLWYPRLFAWISSNEVNAFWQSSKYVAHFVCLLFAGPVNALYEIWIHLRITRDPSGPLSHQCSHRLPKDSLLGVPLMYPTTSFFLYAFLYPFKETFKRLRLCLLKEPVKFNNRPSNCDILKFLYLKFEICYRNISNP